MIRRPVRQVAGAIDPEQADFCAATFVAVANHDNRVGRDKHFVVPGCARIDVWSESINRRNWLQRVVANRYREQTSTTQHHKMIAVKFDDSTFVYAGVLRVGD